MTTNVAIVIILENHNIDPEWKVNDDQTAFEYLKSHVLGALDDIEE